MLVNGAGLGGLLIVLHACLDMKNTILDKHVSLLYYLSSSMRPRYMRTVDENLQPVKASVRVGQAVETVGQAGRPKTITGFQTHTSPVLLGHKDRAELAGRDYVPFSGVLEGVVIVQPVPEEMLGGNGSNGNGGNNNNAAMNVV
ncbi:hypothetical protein EON64_03450 [archaeon]|nr:MAG: hypothetical protein EON64_03450 [archaeon]